MNADLTGSPEPRGGTSQRLPVACEAARRTLSASFDAPLTPAQTETLQTHLDSCAACRAWRATLRRGDGSLAALPLVRPRADIRRTVLEAASQRRGPDRPRRWLSTPVIGVVLLAVLLVATGVFTAALRNDGRGGTNDGGTPGRTGGGGVDVASPTPSLDPWTTLATVETSDGEAPHDCWQDPAFFAVADVEDPNLVQIWFLLRQTSNDCPAPERATLTLGDAEGTDIPLAVTGNPVDLTMDGNPLGVIGHATWANWCGDAAVQIGLDLEADGQGIGVGTSVEPPPCTDAALASMLTVDPDPFSSPWPLSGVGIPPMETCELDTLQPVIVHEPNGAGSEGMLSFWPYLRGETPDAPAEPCLLAATDVTLVLLDSDGSPLDVSGNEMTTTVGGVQALELPTAESLIWMWRNWCSETSGDVIARIIFGDLEYDTQASIPTCVDASQPSTLALDSHLLPTTGAVEPTEEDLPTCDPGVLSPMSIWGGAPHPEVETIHGSGKSFGFEAFGGDSVSIPWSTPTPEPDPCVLPSFEVEVVLSDVHGTPLDVIGNGSVVIIGGDQAGEFPRDLEYDALSAFWTWSNWCGDTPEGILVFMSFPSPRPDFYGAAMPAPECVDPSQPSVLTPDPGLQTAPSVDLDAWSPPTLTCGPTDDPEALATIGTPDDSTPAPTVVNGNTTYAHTPVPYDPQLCTWTYGDDTGSFPASHPWPTPAR